MKTAERRGRVVRTGSRNGDPAIARSSIAGQFLCSLSQTRRNPEHVPSAYSAGIIEQTISFGRDQQKVHDAKHDFETGNSLSLKLDLDLRWPGGQLESGASIFRGFCFNLESGGIEEDRGLLKGRCGG